MKVTLSGALATARIVVVSALLVCACIFASTGTIGLRDVGQALVGGVAVAVAIHAIGLFMTVWYSRRHGIVPDGAPVEPVDEFDVFR